MKVSKGFTLIELVIVIVLLGILTATALPKFVNLSDEALKAKVIANAGALRSGVQLTQMKWRLLGSPTEIDARNDIQIHGSGTSGQVDVNRQGFPVQSYDRSDVQLSTDNTDDCESLWGVLIQDGDDKVARDLSAEFRVEYQSTGICIYRLSANLSLGFSYNTNTGEVNLI